MQKEFYFTGLNWMTSENITQMKQSLSVLEKYGINHKFEQNKGRLTITGYTDTLQNKDNDDDVTFLHKFQGYYGNETHEDTLLIFTITEEMEIKAQVLNYLGNIEQLKTNTVMPKTVTTSKRKPLHPFLQRLKNPTSTGSVPEIQPNEIPYMDWETLIDISEEASISSLREFIINHIGFKAYIIYKLKHKKAIWEADINMINSSLEDLENLKELKSHNDQKLSFLTNLLDEAQLEQYVQWLNQNNL